VLFIYRRGTAAGRRLHRGAEGLADAADRRRHTRASGSVGGPGTGQGIQLVSEKSHSLLGWPVFTGRAGRK